MAKAAGQPWPPTEPDWVRENRAPPTVWEDQSGNGNHLVDPRVRFDMVDVESCGCPPGGPAHVHDPSEIERRGFVAIEPGRLRMMIRCPTCDDVSGFHESTGRGDFCLVCGARV